MDEARPNRLTSCCVMTSLGILLLISLIVFFTLVGFSPFAGFIDAFFAGARQANSEMATSGGGQDVESMITTTKQAAEAIVFGFALLHAAGDGICAGVANKKRKGDWPLYQKRWLFGLMIAHLCLAGGFFIYGVLELVI